ncbi:MAG: FkbM family methyltransferase [Chitinophagaceae bacterium]
MNWGRIRGKLEAGWLILKGKVQPSYSQAGEDQVIRYLFNDCLQLTNPRYLDIGTFHPIYGNNTYYFYLRGAHGVCIEPNPFYASLIRKHRPRDIFLPAGLGVGSVTTSDFFRFPDQYAGWNTFSEEEAIRRQSETGIDYERLRDIPLVNVNEVMDKYFETGPHLISLDVEGLDLDILQSINFNRFRPEVVCVESITFSNSNEQQKIPEIASFMQSSGYFAFADTYVNTIYCRQESFKKIIR